MKIKRSRKVVATAAVVGLLAAGGAYAFWTTLGAGTGSAATAAGASPVVVVQTSATTGLTPGGTPLVLSGNFNNPNTGPVSIPGVFAAVTGTDKGAACLAADYVIAGTATVSASIPVGTGVGSWTGQTIQLKNTALNQDACKGAAVSISYTTVAPIPPAPTVGTVSYTSGVLTVLDVALWPTATGDMTVTTGDQLFAHIPASGWDSASDVPVVDAVNGKFNITSSGYYILHPGVLELKRGGAFFLRTPAWNIG